jgi:hypothetical protein
MLDISRQALALAACHHLIIMIAWLGVQHKVFDPIFDDGADDDSDDANNDGGGHSGGISGGGGNDDE